MILYLVMVVNMITISFLYSLADSFKIKWKLSNDPVETIRLSNIWHGIGLVMRLFIVIQFVILGWLIYGLIGSLISGIVGIISVFPIHNIIIALGLGQKWWYVGTTAKTDILLRKIWKWIVNRWNKLKKLF